MGGRLGGDQVDGFCLDEGADFFCSSYDVAFRMCEELGLRLVRSKMNLGWCRNGRWVLTTPIQSVGALVKNLPAFWTLGFLSPRVVWPILKLVRDINRQAEHLNFSSQCRIVEIDGEETFGDYLERIGVPDCLKTTLAGFLEMTMGRIEDAGAAYMKTYLAEMLLKADQIYVPEKGAGALSHALAAACGDAIRVSTPRPPRGCPGRRCGEGDRRRWPHRGGRGHLRPSRHKSDRRHPRTCRPGFAVRSTGSPTLAGVAW